MEQSVTKRIAKNFSWLFIGNSLNGIIYLFFVVYIARVLGATAFGLFQFTQAFVVYLVMLVDNGLSMLGTREIARDRDRTAAITINFLAVRTILSFCIFVIAWLILAMMPIPNDLRLLFCATFLFIFYRALNTEWVFTGIELMASIPLAKIIFSGGALLLALWLVKGPADLISVPLILALSGFISSVFLLIYVFRCLLPIQLKQLAPSTWANIFWQALPLGASIFLIQINSNFDTIMLGFMDRPEVVGFYGVAYRIFFVCLGFFVIWQQTAIPVMSNRIANDLAAAKNFIKKFASLTAMGFVPVIIFVFLLAPAIVETAFGQQYLAAVGPLRILIWTIFPITLGSCYSVLILIPAGRYYEFLFSVGVSALFNIAMNFILIPSFSMIGAAIATACAELAGFMMAMYYARKIIEINLAREYWRPVLFASLSAILFLLTQRVLGMMPGYLQLTVAGIVYTVSYAILLFLYERKDIYGYVKEITNRMGK
ncbi:MAG: flippase [Candidatus Margulisiibacteriota bacterium]